MTTTELTNAIVKLLGDGSLDLTVKASPLAGVLGSYPLDTAKGIILVAYDSTPAFATVAPPVPQNEIIGLARSIKKTLRFVIAVGVRDAQALDKAVDEVEEQLTNRLAPGYRAFMPVAISKLFEEPTSKSYWRQIYFDTEARTSPQIRGI